LLLLIAGVAFPLVVGYHVDPVSANLSGWTHRGDNVSQVLTINFDELDSTSGAYCELFAGSRGAGGAYHVSVRTYPGDFEVATGDTHGNVDHKWVKFNLGVTYPESIVKGKQLEFRFTRSGSDSIQFYYQGGNPSLSDPYPWGWMRVGGADEVCMDLCARVYGHPKVGGQATAA